MRNTEFAKRLLDLGVSVGLLPLAVPLCLALMAAIRLESPGSPLFVQRRLGREERPMRMLKLRTMYAATGDLPSHLVGSHRITRVGAVLRRLKLDELPQLLNILSGSMSLVGPRPCLPNQDELIRERRKRGVFAYRPGVTGPAQLTGIDMSQPARLADVESTYFSKATIWEDLALIVRTAVGGGQGDAATGSISGK